MNKSLYFLIHSPQTEITDFTFQLCPESPIHVSVSATNVAGTDAILTWNSLASIFAANLSPHTTGSNNHWLVYCTPPELERLW